MKNRHTSRKGSSLLPIVMLGIMLLAGSVTMQAQTDSTAASNPLFSTSGPNVMGAGHLQWYNNMEFISLSARDQQVGSTIGDYSKSFRGFDVNTELRYGVGDHAELNLRMRGSYTMAHYRFNNTSPEYQDYDANYPGICPSVGAKLLLYEGRGWLPRVAFFTHVALPVSYNGQQALEWYQAVQPEIGFQLRNTLGRGWLVDYSLGFSWSKVNTAFTSPDDLLQYSFYLYKLVNNRLALGCGVDNISTAHIMTGFFEGCWQATDQLQLTAKVGLGYGNNFGEGSATQFNALTGLRWNIR